MSAKPQFTPRQILDAGLRAESVSQLDHAAQFYRFLLDHHGGAPEAEVARGHLQRITSSRPVDGPDRADTPPTNPSQRRSSSSASNGGGGPVPGLASATGPALPTPTVVIRGDRADRPSSSLSVSPHLLGPQGSPGQFDPAAGYGSPQPPPGDPLSHTPLSSYPNAYPPAGHQGSRAPEQTRLALPHFNLPPSRRRYGVGRFLAGVTIGVGLLALVGGSAILGLAIAAPTLKLPLPLPLGLQSGLTALLAGLAALFVGQAARALFDSANSTRELVDILRAIADPDADDGQGR